VSLPKDKPSPSKAETPTEPSVEKPQAPPPSAPAPEPEAEPKVAAKKPETSAPTMTSEQVQALLAERLAPLQRESDVAAVARKIGCSIAQAEAIVTTRSKYQGMTDEQAYVLARHESPSVFEQRAYRPDVHGTAPGSGESPARSQVGRQDKSYGEQIREAGDDPNARRQVTLSFLRKSLTEGATMNKVPASSYS